MGYAFITMDNKNDAEDAIDALNGRQIDGQDVKVEMAHPKGSGKSREGYGRRDFGDRGGYGGDRYGDRNGDRDRGYRGGAARFDGGYSRNDRGYGRERDERRSERGSGYSRREERPDRDRGS